MSDDDILLDPGTLREALLERTRTALEQGALQPIETEQVVVEDGGVCFLVRVVSSLRRKEAERRRADSSASGRGRPPESPFLPPEPELTVAEVSTTHVAVLNKFNVLPHHLLVVTRAFEHQEALLAVADFQALLACMAGMDSLGFYNGGEMAGASQAHKHLQLVPLPLGPDGRAVPIDPLLKGDGPHCPGLPFAHAFAHLRTPVSARPSDAATEAHGRYLELLSRLGIGGLPGTAPPRQSAPYNLLMARNWMLLVPRSRERFEGVSVNALGFAGSLFVKDRDQLARIRAAGPMAVLEAVAGRLRG